MDLDLEIIPPPPTTTHKPSTQHIDVDQTTVKPLAQSLSADTGHIASFKEAGPSNKPLPTLIKKKIKKKIKGHGHGGPVSFRSSTPSGRASISASSPIGSAFAPTPSLPKSFRLTVSLRNAEDYIFDIPALLAKQKSEQSSSVEGFASALTPSSLTESSLSKPSTLARDNIEGEFGGHPGDKALANGHVIPARKARTAYNEEDDYDVNDPFIDDSDLALELAPFLNKPKVSGFFAALGPIEHERVSRVSEAKGGVRSGGLEKASLKRKKKRPPTEINGVIKRKPLVLLDSSGSVKDVVSVLVPSKAKDPGISDVPMGLNSGEDAPENGTTVIKTSEVNQSIDGATLAGTSTMSKKQPNLLPIPTKLNEALDVLREAVAKEGFENRNRFPQALEEPLLSTARLALELEVFDDNFFNILTTIFPYNKFTLKKLVTRRIFGWRMETMKAKQEEMKTELRISVKQEMGASLDRYLNELRIWRKQQAATNDDVPEHTASGQTVTVKAENAAASMSNVNTLIDLTQEDEAAAPTSAVAAPARTDTQQRPSTPVLAAQTSAYSANPALAFETPRAVPQAPSMSPMTPLPQTPRRGPDTPSLHSPMDTPLRMGNDHLEDDGVTDADPRDNPSTGGAPKKRFKWTERIRLLLFDIVQIEMEMTALTNEKTKFEAKSGVQPELISEHRVRKTLYAELVSYWPPDWCSTYDISREYSVRKRRVKKEIEAYEDRVEEMQRDRERSDY